MSTKVGEPKRAGTHTVRMVRRHRRKAGEIHSFKGLRLNIYWMPRRTDEYIRADESWAIPAETISAIRAYGVTHVGMLIEDGTRMLIHMDAFGQAGKDKGVTYKSHGKHPFTGGMHWHIPERLFAVKRPPEDMREESLTERMRIPGTSRRAPSKVSP
jgi:hypothetical protein